MQIKVYGYEPFEAMVDYEKLDERLPTLDATLIPSESMRPGQEFLAISGQIAGLSSIEAVQIARPLSGLREFDPKRCVMTIYMPNRRMYMVHTHYGLVNTAEQTFEPFDIVEELPDKRVRIGAPLQGTYPQNAPICRLIYGQVLRDGSYLLRIRVTGKNEKHLIRFVLNGRVGYHLVDFKDPSTWDILEGFQTEEPLEELMLEELLSEGEGA
jgi:hypothetical protein